MPSGGIGPLGVSCRFQSSDFNRLSSDSIGALWHPPMAMGDAWVFLRAFFFVASESLPELMSVASFETIMKDLLSVAPASSLDVLPLRFCLSSPFRSVFYKIHIKS